VSLSSPVHSLQQRSLLGLGTSSFGEYGSETQSEVEAIQCALDLGVRVIDCAEMYAEGRAEMIVGRAIKHQRSEVYLTTKINPWHANVEKMAASCHASLKRLETDYIDLYLLHWKGPVPLEESVYALEQLKRQGSIRDWGVSNFDLPDLTELLAVSGRIVGIVNQVLYNPLRRYAEFKLKPESLVAKNIVFQAYSPFDGTRKFNLEIFESIAKRYNASARAVLLAWIVFKGFQPIFKSTQRTHIEENIKALNLNLTTEDIALIDNTYPFDGLRVQALERDDNAA
jgi:diketogulonate reductase-like aldo/keto reductase